MGMADLDRDLERLLDAMGTVDPRLGRVTADRVVALIDRADAAAKQFLVSAILYNRVEGLLPDDIFDLMLQKVTSRTGRLELAERLGRGRHAPAARSGNG